MDLQLFTPRANYVLEPNPIFQIQKAPIGELVALVLLIALAVPPAAIDFVTDREQLFMAFNKGRVFVQRV